MAAGRTGPARPGTGAGEIVRRHEALRTTFPSAEGRPHQRITPPQPQRLPVVTLDHLPPDQQAAEARRLATEAWRRPSTWPTDRCYASAAALGPDQHVLVLSMHHIVGDAWSIGVVTESEGVLDEAFAHDQPSPLPELPIQYADDPHGSVAGSPARPSRTT